MNSATFDTGRSTIRQECFTFAKQHLLLGNGPEYLSRIVGSVQNSSVYAFHCHNQFLDDLVNYGIFYTGLVIFFLIYNFISFFKGYHNLHGLAIFIFILIICTAETPLRFWTILDYSWVFPLFFAFSETIKKNRVNQ